jgi:hypothetical protein
VRSNPWSSSISSSDKKGVRPPATIAQWPDRRTGLLVLLVVLAVFGALEVFTRVKLFKMSKDFAKFMTFDERSRTVVATPDSVAFIGNSATMYGVDAKLVASELEGRCGAPVASDLFTADASRVNTWRYILESSFWHPQRKPSTFVITFYEDDLADGNRIEIGRVAQFFTSPRDWREIFRVDLHGFGERVEFLVSSYWATYAVRARIRERVLGLIPGYKAYLPAMNEVIYKHEQAAAAAAPHRARTHHALERLLERAREEGSRLVFVAYPTQEAARGNPYALDPTTVEILHDAGVQLLDLRRVDSIPPELYIDDIHLGEEGRERWSRLVAAALPCGR